MIEKESGKVKCDVHNLISNSILGACTNKHACSCVFVDAAVGVDLIISAACSGVRSSAATLLIFTSWSPGTSRPSAGPPAHTKCLCVVMPEGVQLACIHTATGVDDRQ